MVFIRRIKRKGNTYVYRIKTYRDKGTGKVKQDAEYLGKEIIRGNKTVRLSPKRKTRRARAILDHGLSVALYRLAEEFGLPLLITRCVGSHTRIPDVGLKITVLAINKVTDDTSLRSTAYWFMRTALRERLDLTGDDFTPKKIRDIYMFLAKRTPDVVGIIEEGIARRIREKYGEDLDTLVYDLTPLTYYGDSNSLARYGHVYGRTGEKQVNMVLAVTMDHQLPIHHRVLPGNIVSVSTLQSFVQELAVFGVHHVVLVIDRGFYSYRNIREVLTAEHGVIGALSSNLELTQQVLRKSGDMENSRYRIRYPNQVLFAREYQEDDLRVLVYYDPKQRSADLQRFYEGFHEVEKRLEELQKEVFPTKDILLEEVTGICGEYIGFFRPHPRYTQGWTFTYTVKHKAVQRATNHFGKTVLFTSTTFGVEEVLRLYREKDVIDKTFRLMKDRGLTPLSVSTETSTRARVFLAYVGYLLLSLLRMKLKEEVSLEDAVKRLTEVREVVYQDGSRSLPELTKEQKAVFKMLDML